MELFDPLLKGLLPLGPQDSCRARTLVFCLLEFVCCVAIELSKLVHFVHELALLLDNRLDFAFVGEVTPPSVRCLLVVLVDSLDQRLDELLGSLVCPCKPLDSRVCSLFSLKVESDFDLSEPGLVFRILIDGHDSVPIASPGHLEVPLSDLLQDAL